MELLLLLVNLPSHCLLNIWIHAYLLIGMKLLLAIRGGGGGGVRGGTGS